MKLLERAYIFQCPECNGSGHGPTYSYPIPHTYYDLEPSFSPFPTTQIEEGYSPCSLCKGSRVIFLTAYQIEPENLAAMGLMLEPEPHEDNGPEVRRVTIMPRNKSEQG